VAEAVREGLQDPLKAAREWGVSEGGALEATAGMKAAVFEFLAANRAWGISAHFENDGGLTILYKKTN